MEILSTKRKQILDFIATFLQDRGYAPAVRDIAKGCGISSSSIAQYHLNVLEREGYIRRDHEVSRSIGLTKRKTGTVEIPLLGTIAAGEPIPVPSADTWVTTPEESLEVPQDLTRGRDRVYALRVKGTSMVDALIDDGDIVLMQQASTAENGEMVAVWLRDKQAVTLKRIYREAGRIRLQPVNRQMKPLCEDAENVEIQGKVVGVIRKVKAVSESRGFSESRNSCQSKRGESFG
ncbi:MAG: repressor LexA [Chloroflexi bacterium]|nr:MAG: repressor LexA [Chloroflexota bacterium]